MNPDALTNEIPSVKYLGNMRPSVLAESDRGVVIMCSSMVEQALKTALCQTLTHMDAKELKDWFDGHNAPFQTFDAKIRLGRGLKIYDDGVEAKLNLIRKIRNVFAHRSLPLDLPHAGLKGLYNPLLSDLGDWPQLTPREVFAGYCLAVTNVLRSYKVGQILRP